MSNNKKWSGIALGLLVALSVGYGVDNLFVSPSKSQSEAIEETVSYTCSMHPNVKKSEPGKCPLCAMNLIPVVTHSNHQDETMQLKKERKVKYWQAPMDANYKRDTPGKSPMGMALVPVYEEDDNGADVQQLRLSKRAEKLAGVEVSPVIRDFGTETLRLTGKLMVDETRLETISAWFSGRIETLFIDYTGLTVEKNTHMATMYSPDLLVAQKELLEAMRSQSLGLINSSKEKLRLWGLSTEQIQTIIRTGKISDTVTLQAPIGGTVLTKYVKEGEYLKTGSKIYDIADLDRLWLIADVYENDASKLSYGQALTFTTLAYPGKVFNGTITFIDPIVNSTTRTIRVRAIVDNKRGELKPEMLAKVSVNIRYGVNGPIQDGEISDLWVSPMHPEEFSTTPGSCPICGMTLKKASELGLTNANHSVTPPLLIPATAPLITGKRAIVYIQVPNKIGVYEGREIHLGPKVGDYYIVLQGVQEGDYVVTKGNFKIDSAMQLQAKASMMQPDGGKSMSEHHH